MPKVPKQKQTAWPTIGHKDELGIVELLPNKQIIVCTKFFTLEECKKMIELSEGMNYEQTERGPPKRGYAFRDNDRILVNNQKFADHVWEAGLKDAINDADAVGLNPNIRFYKYSEGQQFGAHIDESVVVDENVSKYTVLIYLSGGTDGSNLKGGDLVFYKGRKKVVASIKPEAGLLVIHEHGDRCLQHEALSVLKGVKYVFRTDIMYAK
ncbi:hypothetical protein AKO1_008527 [Acrasis kona]|uniref:Fe2OG dioxygenase domain-containing protein n=1 Tax=Acrasis kona TaxID=1008807 RepID=A0AAW2YML3_9EUKA